MRLLDEAADQCGQARRGAPYHGDGSRRSQASDGLDRGLHHASRTTARALRSRPADGTPAAAKAARGLRNMRSRAARCGAELELAPTPQGALRCNADFPRRRRVRLTLPHRFPDSDGCRRAQFRHAQTAADAIRPDHRNSSGVPARTPTPTPSADARDAARTPTRATPTAGVTTAAAATGVGRTTQPLRHADRLAVNHRGLRRAHAAQRNDATAENAATVRPALSHPVFFNISSLLISRAALRCDRSVTAADVRRTWCRDGARQHAMKMVGGCDRGLQAIVRCHEHGMDRHTQPRRVFRALDLNPHNLVER